MSSLKIGAETTILNPIGFDYNQDKGRHAYFSVLALGEAQTAGIFPLSCLNDSMERWGFVWEK